MLQKIIDDVMDSLIKSPRTTVIALLMVGVYVYMKISNGENIDETEIVFLLGIVGIGGMSRDAVVRSEESGAQDKKLYEKG